MKRWRATSQKIWAISPCPQLPISLQPFTVAEFFPTPGLSDYYDPRQHAIALCYVVPIAGDCKPQDETLDVEWVDPSGDMLDTFVGNGQRLRHHRAAGARMDRQVGQAGASRGKSQAN